MYVHYGHYVCLHPLINVHCLFVCLPLNSCTLYFVHALLYFTFYRSLSVVIVPCVQIKILIIIIIIVIIIIIIIIIEHGDAL